MNLIVPRLWREDTGVLSFEWVIIITLLVIGIVGGFSSVRDALNIELGGVAGAAAALDKSYTVDVSSKHHLGSAFSYRDPKSEVRFVRQDGAAPQPPVEKNVHAK
ncbi:MAG: hypothetical protein JXB10_02595 [Pirellulales bacterium]|nr:hypothetical protein [Pirellulales bacterium]